MFLAFFFRELRGGLTRPMVYIFMLLFALLCFGAVSSDNIVIGGSIGNIHKNAPHIITTFVTTLSLFGLLFAAAFCNNAALRDFNNQFHEILFSTPLSRTGFFFGHFFGAFILSLIPFLGIYLGMALGSIIAPAAGWVDADRFGPLYWESIINTFLIFVVPNMLFGCAIIFWLAHRFRSTVVSFVGALLILVAYGISGTLLSDIENENLAALTDTFGIRAYSVYSKYFTALERNTLSPQFSGLLLQNRLIWLGAAGLIILFSYLTFSTRERKTKARKQKKKSKQDALPKILVPVQTQVFNGFTNWKQFWSFFRVSSKSIIKSTVFRILFLFCAILLISNMVGGFEYFGLQSYPVTYKMMEMVEGNTSLFVLIIMVFFSGELVWRDRMNHIYEVINATPHHSFASLAAKTLALSWVSVLLHLFFIALSIIYQLLMGFTAIELDVYLGSLVLDSIPGYLLYSCIFIFFQVIFSNRYLGYFISVLSLFVFDLILSALDISTNMLDLGGGPSLFYSDMNGFGNGIYGAIWFGIYWLLFGIILLMLAGALVNRTTTNGFKDRVKQMRKGFAGKYLMGFGVVLLTWFLTAGFVYYNTLILNDFNTPDENEKIRVEYEKSYKKYESVPQPKLVAVNYFIDIFPDKRDLYVRAEMQLQNKAGEPIDSLFFNTSDDWEVEFDIPGATMVMEDEHLGFLIYKLDEPLDSGEQMEIEIQSNYISRGFENTAGNRFIARNGTFVNNAQILPAIGYQEGVELLDKNDRKKHGLKPKKRIPELEENCSDKCMVNYLSNGASDWVDVETVISTSGNQLAIAPGSLVKEWQEGKRKYFKYKVDQRSQDFYSFMSADFEVARRKWKGIDLEVYYDEKHPYNIEMMLDAIQSSLEYYTEHFGPYYHKQARIIEFPRYATFAQAFPGTMPYSEAFGFITNLEDTTENNVVQAVIAHEMAHQWWAHQEIPAKMQGGTFLTESFSEYSSLMVMKQENDDLQMKNFLKYDFNRYLRGRGSERVKELPLYKVENQSYIHYGKGSVIMYALQDYIGEDSVNAALRDFLVEFRYAEPPYPTSLDFLKHLEKRVPDSLQYLIDDWFKKITLYDFRLKEAELTELGNEQYEVKLNIEAHKIYADTIGHETVVAPNDWVDIGLYADNDEEELITIKRVKFDGEELQFTLKADQKPVKAAIDPKRLLIERVIDDNVKSVTEK